MEDTRLVSAAALINIAEALIKSTGMDVTKIRVNKPIYSSHGEYYKYVDLSPEYTLKNYLHDVVYRNVNNDGYNFSVINERHVGISFSFKQFPSCCGAMQVYGINFYSHFRNKKSYALLDELIQALAMYRGWNGITCVGSKEEKPYINEMCELTGWTKGHSYKSKKTHHQLTFWSREVDDKLLARISPTAENKVYYEIS